MNSLIALIALAAAASSPLKVECNGYNPVINDHVESEGEISGTTATWNGAPFKVTRKGHRLVLTGVRSQVVIDRATGQYVVYRRHKRHWVRAEWSRRDQDDNCGFSN